MEDDCIHKKYTLKDLEDLLDSIPYEVWIKDEDGKYRYINKAFAQRLNIIKQDIIGKTDYDFGIKATADMFTESDRYVLNKKIGVLTENNIKINNEEKCFETYKSPLYSEGEKSKWIMAIAKDITLDRKIEYEINKSSTDILYSCKNKTDNNFKYNKNLVHITNEICKRLKADGISLFLYNKKEEKLNLYSKSGEINVLNESYDLDIKDNIMNKKYTNKKKRTVELNKDNVQSVKEKLYITTYPIINENEFLGLINVYNYKEDALKCDHNDFVNSVCDRLGLIIKNEILYTNLRRELKKREDSEQELELFLDTATDLCAITKESDKQLIFKNVGNKWSDTFGWSEEEIKKINVIDLIHPEDICVYNKVANDYIKNGRNLLLRCRCKNNEYKTIEWNWTYIENKETILITGKDMSQEKLLLEEKKKLEEAIVLESLKTEFFANMSHEFKTPLNIIITTVQLITSQSNECTCVGSKEKMRSYIKGIEQNSYRLLKLVNNLIDMTKIEEGYYELSLGNYNIVSVIEEIVDSVSEHIIRKKRNIIFDTNEEEVIIACDPEKIERIILNLLSNALKYTGENGNINVNLKSDREKQKVIVSVKDDGIGIAKEYSKIIFERFRQAENLFSRRCEGSGIGLALVKSLVELHGGDVWANTNVDKGAEIIFELPLREVKEETKTNILNDRALGAKIEKYNLEFSDIYSE